MNIWQNKKLPQKVGNLFFCIRRATKIFSSLNFFFAKTCFCGIVFLHTPFTPIPIFSTRKHTFCHS